MAKDVKQITLRIEHDLYDQVVDQANVNKRSVTAQINVMLEDHINTMVDRDTQIIETTDRQQKLRPLLASDAIDCPSCSPEIAPPAPALSKCR